MVGLELWKSRYRELLRALRRRSIRLEVVPALNPQQNTLFVEVAVAKLTQDGFFVLPDSVEAVWVDVGMSFHAPNAVDWLHRNPRGLVVGFEPDYRMYLSYFAFSYLVDSPWIINGKMSTNEPALNERRRILAERGLDPADTPGHLPPDMFDRLIVFPAAVSETEGFAQLHHAKHHGSSSLDERWVRDANLDVFGERLESEQRSVRTLPLSFVLERLPTHLDPLHHLKIDAEGLDGKVLLSAGDQLARFVIVTLEQPDDALMAQQGFYPEKQQRGGFSYRNKRFPDVSVDYAIFV